MRRNERGRLEYLFNLLLVLCKFGSRTSVRALCPCANYTRTVFVTIAPILPIVNRLIRILTGNLWCVIFVAQLRQYGGKADTDAQTEIFS